MNTARRTKTSMPYRPAPTPPGETSPSRMLTSGTAPPPGVKLSCEEIDGAGRRAGGRGRERAPRSRRRSAPPCPPCWRPRPRRGGCRCTSKYVAVADGPGPQHEHGEEDRPALPLVPDEAAEGVGEREGDEQQGEDLEEVGEAGRVLERMGRVRVDDAAAVRAQLLDRLLAGDRARGRWSASRPPRWSRRPGPRSVCTTPRPASTTASTSASGSRTRVTPRVRSTQKLPMVSAALAREAADQGDGDRHADRGRDEVLHGEPGHLDEVAHRRLAGVVLPVGVGDEAHGGVEGEERRHRLDRRSG